jgi:hypothetical protein
MRTTLNLDDDVLVAVQRVAASRRVSVGHVVSDLVRRSLNRPVTTRLVNGISVFDLPADSPLVTAEDVKRLENEAL